MTITGLDDFLHEYARDVVETAAEALLEDLKDRAPFDTGELVDSAYGPFFDDLTATLGFSAPQAEYTDQGTEPHEIYPSNAKALQFYWPNGPNGPGLYTFDHVNHPGQDGTGWFTESVADWDTYVQEAV